MSYIYKFLSGFRLPIGIFSTISTILNHAGIILASSPLLAQWLAVLARPEEISKHYINDNKVQVLSPSKGSVRIKIMNIQSICMYATSSNWTVTNLKVDNVPFDCPLFLPKLYNPYPRVRFWRIHCYLLLTSIRNLLYQQSHKGNWLLACHAW